MTDMNYIEEAVVKAVVDVLLLGETWTDQEGNVNRSRPRLQQLAEEIAKNLPVQQIIDEVSDGIRENPAAIVEMMVDMITSRRGIYGKKNWAEEALETDILQSSIAAVLSESEDFREKVAQEIVLREGDEIKVTVEVKRAD